MNKRSYAMLAFLVGLCYSSPNADWADWSAPFDARDETGNMRVHPCTGDTNIMYSRYNQTTMEVQVRIDGYISDPFISAADPGFEGRWVSSTLALIGLNCGQVGGAASPVGYATEKVFEQTVFSSPAVPRMMKQRASEIVPRAVAQPSVAAAQPAADAKPTTEKKSEDGKAVALEVAPSQAKPVLSLPLNDVSADLEWDLFGHADATGNSFYVRAGYSRTTGDGKIALGGNFIFNTLLMMNQTFVNNALNLYGNYRLVDRDDLVRKICININGFLVDKNVGKNRLGCSVAAHYVDNWYLPADQVLTYGAMVQQSFVGALKTMLLSAGAQYGLPLGERFSLNGDAVYTRNIFTFNGGKQLTIENPNFLSLGASGAVYLSQQFVLNAGLKTSLLMKDYRDLIITIGSSKRF
jgi:hypothetical protein